MVSMKNTPKEIAEEKKEMASPAYDMPEYPYSLRICLCEDEIKKLSMTLLPAIGQEMMLSAKVKVVGVSSDETEHGARRRIEFQITDMGFDAKKDPSELAKKMYAKK